VTEPDIYQQEDRWLISGDLNFASVPLLLGRFHQLPGKAGHSRVDLAGVGEMDSAGLGLLLEWVREAHASGDDIHFSNIPADIMSLARVCGLEHLLNQA